MTNELLAEISLLKEKVARLEKERDAAVEDMTLISDEHLPICYICKNGKDYPMNGKCRECYLGSENNFEWRGVQDDTK